MENLEIIFILLLSAIILVGIAQKINVPYPIILVFGGAALSFIPGLDRVYFNPSLALLVFLPPVLYYSAFGISFREFQRSWKSIFSLALGLVALTTVVIAVIFKWLFPQFPWALAFAFGAIVSPPDAIAVTSILKRFSINSRLVTMLEGESLINDASALVIYKMSMITLMTGSLSLSGGTLEFVYVVLGGVAVGFTLGIIFQEFARRYLEPVLGVVFSFTIPYVTYILADMLAVSGVLAVVVNGLIGARILHNHRSPLRRILGYAVWDVLMIILNCLVFILIGVQVKTIAGKFSTDQIFLYTGYALLIFCAMTVVRFIWVYVRAGFSYMNAVRRHDSSMLRSQILREAAIVGWAGMRGLVSLAVALALPFTMPDGSLLVGRNEVVFIAFVVILMTLLVPGLTLLPLIRWLKLRPAHEDDNEQKIRKQLAQYAEEKINLFFKSEVINQHEYRFLKSYFHSQHKVLELAHEAEHNLSNIEHVRRKIIHSQRTRLIEIWKLHQIDDKHLNHLENELDMLETHTARVDLKRL